MYEEIKAASQKAMQEILDAATWRAGDIVVVGCSSSEIVGERIGKGSTPDAAKAVVEAVLPLLEEKGLYLAAQCCEHLNRALIIERAAADKYGYEPVCVVPKPKAGGSFATAAWAAMREPVAVEHIKAVAGLDVGSTLIGMHLKDVAVPLRLSVKNIGSAYVTAAYTRPKLIGGARAQYE
jgi:uncharacterized protein (TIGR01440 family)